MEYYSVSNPRMDSKIINKLIYDKKLDEALDKIEECMNKYPNDTYFNYYKGQTLFLLKDLENAEVEFLKVVNSNNYRLYGKSYKFLGEISRSSKHKNYDSAINYFLLAIENQDEIASYVALAQIYTQQCNYDKTLEILNQCQHQDNPEVLYEKARALESMNKKEEANATLDLINMKEVKNKSLYAKINVLKSKFVSNDYCQAKQYLVSAVNGLKNYNYWLVIFEFGKLNKKHNKYAEALKCFNQALDNEPRLKDKIILEIGDIYYNSGLYEKAINEYKKISENSKYYSKALCGMAIVNMAKGDFKEAKNHFEKSMSIDKFNKTKNLYPYAIALFRNKEYDKAKTIIDSVDYKQLSPGDIVNYNFLKEILNNVSKNSNYAAKQMKNYSIDRLISYMIDSNIKIQNGSFSSNNLTKRFADDIDIESLCINVADMIETREPNKRSVFDFYSVDYDGIGYIDGDKVDTLEIVTLPDTKKVISFNPHFTPDIITMNKKQSNISNRLSQSEKFYKKYGKK